MKVRYENNNLLADFNYRGWNPQTLMRDISEIQYERFISRCEVEYEDLEDVTLTNAIKILILMAKDGDFL